MTLRGERPGAKKAAFLRALEAGDKTLAQLATAVYGVDSEVTRRKASGMLRRRLRIDGEVESVDRRGTWRLARPGAQP